MYSRITLAAYVLLLTAPLAFAQEPLANPDELRAEWPEMTNQAFVDAVVASRQARKAWPSEDKASFRASIYEEAARRVRIASSDLTDVIGSANNLVDWAFRAMEEGEEQSLAVDWLTQRGGATLLSGRAVQRLMKVAAGDLTPEQLAALRTSIETTRPVSLEMGFSQLKDYLDRTAHAAPRTHEYLRERKGLVASWVREHDLASVSNRELRSLFWFLRPIAPGARSIDVEWVGEITAPRSGDFVFDVAPFTVSTSFEQDEHRQGSTVTVGGVTAVEATPGDWRKQRKTVALTGDTPVPFRVTLSISGKISLPRRGVGQLYWDGPGMTRQLVAPRFFRQAGGGGSGVRCNVSWVDDQGQTHSDSAVVDHVDQVFGRYTVTSHPEELGMVVNEKIRRLTTPQAFVKGEKEGSTLTRFPLAARRRSLGLMLQHASSEQRVEVASWLIDSPADLQQVSLYGIRKLVIALQPGAEREALDVFGAWVQRHRDVAPRLTSSREKFFKANRAGYRHACIPLLWEHAESFDWLEEDYLETDDGSCALPAAYVLAYGYVMQGKALEWIEKLDAKLDDEAITGDARVNWLIARAMAEEIRLNAPERHYRGRVRLNAGLPWIKEALQTAASPATEERVLIELAARHAALGGWDEAEALLVGHPQRSDLDKRIVQLKEQRNARMTKQRDRAHEAYVTELQRRRQDAVDRGDSVAEQRYAELISRSTREEPAIEQE